MRLHTLRHVPYEGLGHVGAWARAAGYEISESRGWESVDFPDPAAYDVLVVLGGPMGVADTGRLAWLGTELEYVGRAIASGTPTLGICLGAQMIAAALGAQVRRNTHPEIGWHTVEPTSGVRDSVLTPFFTAGLRVMQWHYDAFDLPSGAVHLARSEACEHQAFSWDDHVLALQFHPEMTHGEVATVIERDGPLREGPYTQPAEAILVPQRFETLRAATATFLDRLQTRWAPLSDAVSVR